MRLFTLRPTKSLKKSLFFFFLSYNQFLREMKKITIFFHCKRMLQAAGWYWRWENFSLLHLNRLRFVKPIFLVEKRSSACTLNVLNFKNSFYKSFRLHNPLHVNSYLYLTCLLKEGFFLGGFYKSSSKKEARTIKCSILIPSLKLTVGKGLYIQN